MEVIKGREFTTVMLQSTDDLKAVPRGHRMLLTPILKVWWSDPRAALEQIAEGAPGPNMRSWFRAMAERGEWVLNLHKSRYGADAAGIACSAPGIHSAEVGPPNPDAVPDGLPPALEAFYRQVGYFDWSGFGNAGGLEAANSHARMTSYAYLCEGCDLDPQQTFIFGWGASGDMLFYTTGGEAGWLSHDTGDIVAFAGVTEALEWVFGELLAGRCPDH